MNDLTTDRGNNVDVTEQNSFDVFPKQFKNVASNVNDFSSIGATSKPFEDGNVKVFHKILTNLVK
jgi:hypothetical protein